MDTATSSAAGIELRRSPRQDALKRATVAFNQGFTQVECLIRNVSETGAKLRFAALAMAPPDEFRLIAVDASNRDCRVVWRRAQEVGVEFR
jgi:hypothetical protein